jgi:hypothetical protein
VQRVEIRVPSGNHSSSLPMKYIIRMIDENAVMQGDNRVSTPTQASHALGIFEGNIGRSG